MIDAAWMFVYYYVTSLLGGWSVAALSNQFGLSFPVGLWLFLFQFMVTTTCYHILSKGVR